MSCTSRICRATAAAAAAAAALTFFACAGEPSLELDAPASPVPRSLCDVSDVDGLVTLRAFDDGIALASASPGSPGDVIVQRARGIGCALTLDPGAAVAAEALLDVDDAGNLYVFPAEASAPGVVSTMLDGEYRGSMVARVDADDASVTKLLPAGRGIWSFGVSSAGDALWVSACGPTGIYDIAPDGAGATLSTSLAPPSSSLWEAYPSVLSDADTFFAVGARTCDASAGSELSDACGHALVRATPQGVDEVGATVADFGAGNGFEQATLSRCGAEVCGTFASAVVVWDREGRVVQTIPALDVAWRGERIASATGNRHGTYVLVVDDAGGARVAFVAR